MNYLVQRQKRATVIVAIVVVCACGLASCNQVLADSWGTVLLRDDFNSSGTPNPSTWVVNRPGQDESFLGRSHFPNPLSPNYASLLPHVAGGSCVIEHHLYDPYYSGALLGGEIHSVMQFDPTRDYRFEARVKCDGYPNGLVTSFFTYGWDEAECDELDYEFLSNKTNDNTTYPNGDPVQTNTWNETQESPQLVPVAGLDLTQWNTFRLYWRPGESVQWTWLDPVNGETVLRTETVNNLPDEPMSLYFNFWAPTASWGAAYSASLQPVDNPGADQTCSYQIDYVEVCVPEPSTLGLLVAGSVAAGWMAMRRRIARDRNKR
jgi:hypothetical protein